MIGLLLRRLALTMGVGASGLTVGAAGLIYARHDTLPYLPSSTLTRTPADVGLAYEDLTLTTEDGERLGAWWVPAMAGRGSLIFFHGASGTRSRRVDAVKRFHGLGLDVLIVDYRGYGDSSGTPSEPGTYLDARAAWNAAITRGAAPESTFVFGRSLGGPIAARLAGEQPAAGLILESTFTSLPDLFEGRGPFQLLAEQIRAEYPTQSNMAAYRGPVLVLHSREDRLIPFRHGEQLRATAGERGTLIEMVGSHSTAAEATGQPYVEALDRFLDRALAD